MNSTLAIKKSKLLMELIDYITIAWSIGILILLFIPLYIAYFYAKIRAVKIEKKFIFSLTCCILVYGITTISSFLFIPFELVKTVVAPKWILEDHKILADIVYVATEYVLGPFIVIVCMISSIIIPVRLKKYWLLSIEK